MSILYDFRSDTVTRPTDAMRRAMAEAKVGDDVFGDDPTINRLQDLIAERLGKEAALYVPSGTMSNLIALRLHAKPGEEILCEENCHIIQYEQAGYAQINGLGTRTLVGEYGILPPDAWSGLLRPSDQHFARTRTLVLENTHNKGGGCVHPYENLKATCDWAKSQGFTTHLDGARLFNAVAASGVPVEQWTQHFNTISICFSKGLGAPVGSALCGDRDWIVEARRCRKALGGAMRQAGVIAAAAIYALEHHVERLADDHANAQTMADAIREIEGLSLSPDKVETNMVFFEVDESLGSADAFIGRLSAQGVGMLALGPSRIRAVTHLDVSTDDVRQTIDILRQTAKMS